MDSQTEDEDLYIPRNELYLIRKEKLRKEIDAAIRILKSNVEPIEIADKFIHNSIKLMEDGILIKNPNISKEELLLQIINNFKNFEKIKQLRTRGKKNGWNKRHTLPFRKSIEIC